MRKKIVAILMAVMCVLSVMTVAFAAVPADAELVASEEDFLPISVVEENVALLQSAPVKERSSQVKALPMNVGFDTLQDQFTNTKASNGKKYSFYSPVINAEDDTKYPVVIYIHGKFHAWTDESYDKSGLTYWACREMQDKFAEGGAHLIMPKIPELSLPATYKDKAMAIIKEYVNKNAANIDMSQIYIAGGSAGGGLATKLILDDPDYFAKAMLLCSTGDISAKEAKKLANMPIWEISANTDPIVNISGQKKNWNNISANSNVKDQCRWTRFTGRVTVPDGSHPGISHFLAKTIGFNFCTISDKKIFSGMNTIDATGKTVNLSWEDSIVEWLQA